MVKTHSAIGLGGHGKKLSAPVDWEKLQVRRCASSSYFTGNPDNVRPKVGGGEAVLLDNRMPTDYDVALYFLERKPVGMRGGWRETSGFRGQTAWSSRS